MNDMTAYKLHSAQFSVLGFLLYKLANKHFFLTCLLTWWNTEPSGSLQPGLGIDNIVCGLKKKNNTKTKNPTKPKLQICNEKQENTNIFAKFARVRFSLLGYAQGKLCIKGRTIKGSKLAL